MGNAIQKFSEIKVPADPKSLFEWACVADPYLIPQ
jgi:hypothetical protein